MGDRLLIKFSCFRTASKLRSFSCSSSNVIAESRARIAADMSLNSSPRPFRILTVRSSEFSGASSIANSSAMLFACCKNSVMDCEPFEMLVRMLLRCMMCPLEGLAYVLARAVHASCAVLAEAMNGMMDGEIEPIMALRRS